MVRKGRQVAFQVVALSPTWSCTNCVKVLLCRKDTARAPIARLSGGISLSNLLNNSSKLRLCAMTRLSRQYASSNGNRLQIYNVMTWSIVALFDDLIEKKS